MNLEETGNEYIVSTVVIQMTWKWELHFRSYFISFTFYLNNHCWNPFGHKFLRIQFPYTNKPRIGFIECTVQGAYIEEN